MEKRLGLSFREFKQKQKGTKLPDDKVIGRKGRFTDKTIDKM